MIYYIMIEKEKEDEDLPVGKKIEELIENNENYITLYLYNI